MTDMTPKEPAPEDVVGVLRITLNGEFQNAKDSLPVIFEDLHPNIKVAILKGQAWDELERWLNQYSGEYDLRGDGLARHVIAITLNKMSSLIEGKGGKG